MSFDMSLKYSEKIKYACRKSVELIDNNFRTWKSLFMELHGVSSDRQESSFMVTLCFPLGTSKTKFHQTPSVVHMESPCKKDCRPRTQPWGFGFGECFVKFLMFNDNSYLPR